MKQPLEAADEDQFEEQAAVQAQEPLITAEKKKELEIVIAFKDEEFLVYDCRKDNWQLGDFNDSSNVVPENAALVTLEPT
jgi:hypothetical protein